jgi:predicted PurR-regulated permease PerM
MTLLVAGLVVAGLYFGRDILIPLALAVLLSFLLAPVMRAFRRLGRVAAVGVAGLVGFLPVVAIVATVAGELPSLADDLPGYKQNVESKIRALPGLIPSDGIVNRLSALLRDMRGELTRADKANAAPARTPRQPVPVEIELPPPTPLEALEIVVAPLLGPAATGGLVLVFVLWILLNREDIRDRLLRLAGGDLHRTTEAMNEAAERVTRYLTTQLAVNVGVGLPVGVGLAAIGIPYAALWGMLVMLLRFVPYLGVIVAASFPLALAVAVDPGWSLLGWTVLLFVVIEAVVGYLIEPHLYGVSTGLSPLAVIIAAVFWTWLWGPVGLLLSTPLTACLVVLGRHVPQLEFLGVLLGNEPALSPEQAFYQRLLADDPEEAAEHAEEFAKRDSLAEFFDTVVLPALAMAQADSDRGVLPPEGRARVARAVMEMLENLPEEPAAGQGRAVCLAGRNELDEAAAALLAHLLGGAEVLPAEALSAEDRHRPALRSATTVCLSLVSTSSPARARYLVRRLRRRAPQARLLVGLWAGYPDVSIAEAAGAIAADRVVASLRDAAADLAAAAPAEAALAQ